MSGRTVALALGVFAVGFWFGLIAHLAVIENSIQAGVIVIDSTAYTVTPMKKEVEK